MYLERPGATTTVRGASDKPRLASETSATTMVRGASDMPRLAPEARVATTAQTGDEEEKEVPDAQMYNFLEPVQVRPADGISIVSSLQSCTLNLEGGFMFTANTRARMRSLLIHRETRQAHVVRCLIFQTFRTSCQHRFRCQPRQVILVMMKRTCDKQGGIQVDRKETIGTG